MGCSSGMYSGLSGGLINYLSVNGFSSYFISVVFTTKNDGICHVATVEVTVATWLDVAGRHVDMCIYKRVEMATWINTCGPFNTCNYGTRPHSRVSQIHVATVRHVYLYTCPNGHLFHMPRGQL
jgi:hypothetical protein